MSNMDIYTLLSSKQCNELYAIEYHKFIQLKQNQIIPQCTYTEKHHICPRSLFPEYKSLKDHPWNRIELTARDHYEAHRLLWKAYGGNMTQAFWYMSNKKNKDGTINHIDAHEYALLKIEVSKKMSERIVTEETRKKQSESSKGKPKSVEHRKNMSKPKSVEHRNKQSESAKNSPKAIEARKKLSEEMKGKPKSDEHRKKMVEAWKTRPPVTNETRKKQSESRKGNPHQKITCPHCNKTGGNANMKRYHFDNCKSYNIFVHHLKFCVTIHP